MRQIDTLPSTSLWTLKGEGSANAVFACLDSDSPLVSFFVQLCFGLRSTTSSKDLSPCSMGRLCESGKMLRSHHVTSWKGQYGPAYLDLLMVGAEEQAFNSTCKSFLERY